MFNTVGQQIVITLIIKIDMRMCVNLASVINLLLLPAQHSPQVKNYFLLGIVVRFCRNDQPHVSLVVLSLTTV